MPHACMPAETLLGFRRNSAKKIKWPSHVRAEMSRIEGGGGGGGGPANDEENRERVRSRSPTDKKHGVFLQSMPAAK